MLPSEANYFIKKTPQAFQWSEYKKYQAGDKKYQIRISYAKLKPLDGALSCNVI